MARYIVTIPEEYRQDVTVEADNEEEALERVKEGNYSELGEAVYVGNIEDQPDWWKVRKAD